MTYFVDDPEKALIAKVAETEQAAQAAYYAAYDWMTDNGNETQLPAELRQALETTAAAWDRARNALENHRLCNAEHN